MNVNFVWYDTICANDKKMLLQESVKEDVVNLLTHHGESPNEISIGFKNAGPFSLTGEVLADGVKTVVYFTHSLLKDGERSYRHWTDPIPGAKS